MIFAITVFSSIAAFAFLLRYLYNAITAGTHEGSFYNKMRKVSNALPWIVVVGLVVLLYKFSVPSLSDDTLSILRVFALAGLAAFVLLIAFLVSTLFSDYCKSRIAAPFQNRFWFAIFAALVFIGGIIVKLVQGFLYLYEASLGMKSRRKPAPVTYNPYSDENLYARGYDGRSNMELMNAGDHSLVKKPDGAL